MTASQLTNIWRWNRIGGHWDLVRDSYLENVDNWLRIFRGDHPAETFKAAKKRPVSAPKVTQ